MHGGPSPGAPKGNQNAFKHGRYSARSISQRRQIAALICEMRETAECNVDYIGSGPGKRM